MLINESVSFAASIFEFSVFNHLANRMHFCPFWEIFIGFYLPKFNDRVREYLVFVVGMQVVLVNFYDQPVAATSSIFSQILRRLCRIRRPQIRNTSFFLLLDFYVAFPLNLSYMQEKVEVSNFFVNILKSLTNTCKKQSN